MKVENKTIIITDPCYLIPEDKGEDWDKCEYGDNMEVLGFTNYECRSTGYGDWSCMVYPGNIEDNTIYKDWDKKYFSYIHEMNLETDSVKIDALCKEFKQFEENFKQKNHILGKFCADAGMVGVFELDEVLKYNPKFNYHIERPWTATVIPNFTGEVSIEEIDGSVHVIGKGNINFFSSQSGL